MITLDNSFVGMSISSATLRYEDLIPAGLGFLADHDPDSIAVLDDNYLADINNILADLPYDYVQKGIIYTHVVTDHIIQLKTITDLGDLTAHVDFWDCETAGDLLTWLWCEDIFDRLNELAPNWCYFGSHEGDGADFGFWVSWDHLHDELSNYPWEANRAKLLGWFRIRDRSVLDVIAKHWCDWDAIADFLESLDHDNLPATIDRLAAKYTKWLVIRRLS